MHDLAVGCGDPERCHLGSAQNPTHRWNIAVGTFDPEVPVETTYADFVAGRDRLLEKVRELEAR